MMRRSRCGNSSPNTVCIDDDGIAAAARAHHRELFEDERRDETTDEQGRDRQADQKAQALCRARCSERNGRCDGHCEREGDAADEGRAFKAGHHDESQRQSQRQVRPPRVAGDQQHGGDDA
jgi:hypothetical protein